MWLGWAAVVWEIPCHLGSFFFCFFCCCCLSTIFSHKSLKLFLFQPQASLPCFKTTSSSLSRPQTATFNDTKLLFHSWKLESTSLWDVCGCDLSLYKLNLKNSYLPYFVFPIVPTLFLNDFCFSMISQLVRQMTLTIWPLRKNWIILYFHISCPGFSVRRIMSFSRRQPALIPPHLPRRWALWWYNFNFAPLIPLHLQSI